MSEEVKVRDDILDLLLTSKIPLKWKDTEKLLTSIKIIHFL